MSNNENKNENTAGIVTAANEPEELVDYIAPLIPGAPNQADVIAAVNGEMIRIKRGVTVQIRRKFKEVLDNAAAQQMEAFKQQEAAVNQASKAAMNL